MINSGEYEECNYGVVIDVYQLTPYDFQMYVADENRRGIFLLRPILLRKSDLIF